MRIVSTGNYESMSQHCVSRMLELVSEKADARIVLATGYSPLLAYRLFAKRVLDEQVDVRHVTWIKLDEWLGVPEGDLSTCEHFLNAEILTPLRVHPDHYIGFDSMCVDAKAECARVSEMMADGGIDLMILGIGKNGHIGLNEPAAALHCLAHVSVLAETTKRHQMLTETHCAPKCGLTLGMGDVFSAREIILLCAGEGKAQALAAIMSGQITTDIPITLLQLHSNTMCIVDRPI